MSFVTNVHKTVKVDMDNFATRPQFIKNEATQEPMLCKLISNINYPFWVKKDEELNEALEKLDGQLSLKNATITITV